MDEEIRGNILIAIPKITFAEGIQKHLKKKNYKVWDIIVDVEHLLESLESKREEGVTIDAIILTSDIAKKLNNSRLELLSDILLKIREKYSETNIILLANEKKGHPFLSEVVQMGIYNVFVKGDEDISIGLIEEVIVKPRTFSNVSAYLNASPEYQWRDKGTSIKPSTEEPVVNKQVVQKQVVKQVVKKEVNKQVVKRNYQINVQNNVEKVVGIPVDKKLIMVGSPFSRSGSTFFSHLLARELTKIGVDVTYIESPYSTSYTYDRFIGHSRNPDYRSKFYHYTKEIDPKKPSITDWKVEDIQLIAKHPSEEPIYSENEVPFDVFVKVLLANQSTITIVDVGTDWDKEVYKDVFDIAATSYLVMEPDISNIQLIEDEDNEKTQFYRDILSGDKTTIIGNRFDVSILKNDLIRDLYQEKIKALIPEFPSKDVFKCQFEGGFINDVKAHQKLIKESLNPVIEELLPKQFLKKYRKQNKMLNGLFNKKYSLEREDS